MSIQQPALLQFVLHLVRPGKNETGGSNTPQVPVLFREEPPSLGHLMPLTAAGAVILYAMFPAGTTLLLLATLWIAVHTTLSPGMRAWELYRAAMQKPLDERLELLREACELAPAHHPAAKQCTFALGVCLIWSGGYAEAVNILRALSERQPNEAHIESAIAAAYRMLFTRPDAGSTQVA